MSSVVFTNKKVSNYFPKSLTLAEGEAAWCAREGSHRQSGCVGQRGRDTGGRHPVDQEPCFPQMAINYLLLFAFQSEVFFLHVLFFMLIPAVNCKILPTA